VLEVALQLLERQFERRRRRVTADAEAPLARVDLGIRPGASGRRNGRSRDDVGELGDRRLEIGRPEAAL